MHWLTNGKQEAILEAEKLNLTENHFYYSLLGHLYTDVDRAKAIQHFDMAYQLASSAADQATIMKNIRRLKGLI